MRKQREQFMTVDLRHAVAALLVVAGTGTAHAQTVITTRPAETVVAPAPLQLTPAQRTTVYRTIVPRGRGRQPIVRERIVTETAPATVGRRVVVPPPGYLEEPAYGPPARVVVPEETERRNVYYSVGARVPATVQLAPLPQRVVAANPTLRPYRYMVFRDRVLLVDPVTSIVVADVTP
jgi:hypothetical protein